jgi:hypothetical protein
VTGTVTNDNPGAAFNNNAGGLLEIGATGSFSSTGALTNAQQVTVAAGGALTAASIANTTAVSTLTNAGTVTSAGTISNAGTLTNLSTGAITSAGLISNSGTLTNSGTIASGDGVTNTGTLGNTGSITAAKLITNGGTLTNSGTITSGDGVTNTGTLGNSGSITAAKLITNSGTLSNTGTINSGDGVNNTGTLNTSGTITTVTGFTNSGTVNAQGTITGGITNIGPGVFTVTGALSGGGGNFSNGNGATLTVGGNSFTGINALTNANGGTISIAGGTIGDVTTTTTNSGLIVASGSSTINGTLTNSGTIDLADGGGVTSAFNKLTTTSFVGNGGTVNISYNLSGTIGQAGQLVSTTNSGSTTLNFQDVRLPNGQLAPVVLGGPTQVVVNTGAGGLQATGTGALGQFGLVNVSLVPEGNGNFDLVRTANTGAIAAPGGSILAALSAVDTSFHQSTTPFVVSPQSQDPDKWSGGIWSRASTGQTTTKSEAVESLGGISAALRVKTIFDAYEVGADTGLLNFGNTGWNGHFGLVGGAVTATANEQFSGTQVKFDIPFAGVYAVLTHGPFFVDIEARHDWVDTRITNGPANLNNSDLHGSGNSVSGSAAYHFELPDHWFFEPTAGFGLTQTRFDTLQTNVGQQAAGIAPGAISIDPLTSMLAHAGVRVGTSVMLSDMLAVQPFGTLSIWREFSGLSHETFFQSGTADPVTVNRVGTFYQGGLGLSAQVLNTGLVGFARGDIRWGERLDGLSVVGGLRYTFGP